MEQKLTQITAEFVADFMSFSPPERASDAAVMGIADFFAVMVAGSVETAPNLVQGMVFERSGNGTAPIYPSGVHYDAPDAALINGTAGHVLDYDDVGIDGHPSTVLAPAILAEGFALDQSGEAAVQAYLAGYEIWAFLSDIEPGMLHDRGFHPTAVYGAIAVAAAGAVLHGLDAEQTRNAIAIGASLASGLTANFGSMTKSLHAGRTAQAGLFAARLAARGFTASEDAFEHPSGFVCAHSPSGTPDLGRDPEFGSIWRIEKYGLNIKRYPVCYATHRCIDAAIALAGAHDLGIADVAEIRVEAGRTQFHMLRNTAPRTGLQAKFSMEFAMASAIVARKVGMSELTDGFVQRNDIQSLMSRVKRIPTHAGIPGIPPRAGEPMHADRVQIALKDGRVLTSPMIEYARGSWQNPMSAEELREKFMDCTATILGDAAARRYFDGLMNLRALPSLRELAPALSPA